jgi:hypothetical protein
LRGGIFIHARSRRYRLVGKGYAICAVFLKLFEKIYAPLTAGLMAAFRGDHILMNTSAANSSACISESRWGPYNGNS